MKPSSSSEAWRVFPLRPGRALALLALALLPAALRASDGTVEMAFAAPEASERTFQPLRLTLDLPGEEREVFVRLKLPAGSRVLSPLDRVAAGRGRRVYLLNIWIPDGYPGGPFEVSGEVRDERRVWPVRASLRVRMEPGLHITAQPQPLVISHAALPATNEFTVLNDGNAPLDFTAAIQPSPGLQAQTSPASFALGPGQTQTVAITAQLANPVTTLFEAPLFVTLEARQDDYLRRDTVGFNLNFVPENPRPGSLFGELEGEMIPGWLFSKDEQGFTGLIWLQGEVASNLRLELSGNDGRYAPAGSRVGLSDRDAARVALINPRGRVEGGLVTPPSFGILEPVTQGRGALTEIIRGQWHFSALATRDAYTGFARENAGLQARTEDDVTELGLLFQRNFSTGSPTVERWGGYALRRWAVGRLQAGTDVAVADADNDASNLQFGVEQTFLYNTERFTGDVSLQWNQPDFMLAGRSSRLSTTNLSWRAGAWEWFAHAADSLDVGYLNTYAQRRLDFGLPSRPREVDQAITRASSQQQSAEAGVSRQTGFGRWALSYTANRYATELDPSQSHSEQAGVLNWTDNSPTGYRSVQAVVGHEEYINSPVDFGEIDVLASGQLHGALGYSAELRQTWNFSGFSTAYRRPGTYGQASLHWQPRTSRWRFEAGLDGYNYEQLDSRVNAYVIVEAPVSRYFNLGLEYTTENHDGPRAGWVFLRVPLRLPMPWRPLRGAVSGHVNNEAGTAGLPNVLMDLGGKRALTDASGRFVLPAMPPGRYPLTQRLPAELSPDANWPTEVEVRAGVSEVLELHPVRLALLRGTVTISLEGVERHPGGVVRATREDGRIFEGTVGPDGFQLQVSPGNYTVHFSGKVSEAVADQLEETVKIGANGDAVTVALVAVEFARKERRTVFPTPQEP